MKRHIKFPLFMKDDIPVRTMEELRNNCDIEKLLMYFVDGKLTIWLRDRYEDKLSEMVKELDRDQEDITEKLCQLLGIRYDRNETGEMSDIIIKNEKIKVIRKHTNRSEPIDFPERVAFTQEEFEQLVSDERIGNIYLLNNKFVLPELKRKCCIYGLGTVTLHISVSAAASVFKTGTIIHDIKYDQRLIQCVAFTKDEDILKKQAYFAFTQAEFDLLLRQKAPEIYICADDLAFNVEPYAVKLYGLKKDAVIKVTSATRTSCDHNKVTFNGIKTVFTHFEEGEIVNISGVEWIVLSIDDEKTMLITKNIIKYMEHNTGYENKITWTESEIRKWLNEPFYKSIFPQEPNYHIVKINDDFVSLLSVDEYRKYKKLLDKFKVNGNMWLRDSQDSKRRTIFAYAVATDPGIHYDFYQDIHFDFNDQYTYIHTQNGVRPIIYVKDLHEIAES